MENKKILSKGKLLIALMATLLIVAVVGLLSPKLSMQAYASSVDELLDDAISASIMQNDIIDVMMSDGNLGWNPTIYAAEQAQHEATAEEFLSNSAQTYSTTMSSSTAPHGALRTMHPATQTTNQIVIYIIADRYTDTQQETFFTAAQNIANHIVGAHPVSEYKAWVQIYAMGTISSSSTTSIIAGGSSAGTAQSDITLARIRPFIQHHFPNVTNPSLVNNHSWLVVQNGTSGGYAGVSGSANEGRAVTSTSVGTALHEMGHLWGLWDEYNTSSFYDWYRDSANTKSNVNLTSPKTGSNAIPTDWGLLIGSAAGTNNQWVGIENTGIYQITAPGWGSTTWYRSNQNCVMNTSSHGKFCSVCAELVFRRFATNRQIYNVSTSSENTTITGTTTTGKALTNDMIIPIILNGGLVITIGNGNASVFGGSNTTKISFAAGTQVTTIAANAFSNATQLSQISIPASVVSIGDYAFSSSGLTSISLGAAITSISTTAFRSCKKLAGISVASDNTIYKSEGNCLIQKSNNQLLLGCKNSVIPNTVTSITAYAFESCELTSISIPNSVKSIGSDAFYHCDKLTDISIGAGMTNIDDYAFRYCSEILANITIDSNNAYYKSEGNCLIRKSDNALMLGTKNSIIPNGVTNINAYSFFRSEITNITIPASVLSIADGAFYNSYLTNITFAPNSQLTSIEDFAFSSCRNLITISIPKSVLSIGSAFDSCENLTSVIIDPDGQLNNISDCAFLNCNSLLSITIPVGVTYVGFYAFSDCSNLTIYTDLTHRPDGWSPYWNYSNCPVYWAGSLGGLYGNVASADPSAMFIYGYDFYLSPNYLSLQPNITDVQLNMNINDGEILLSFDFNIIWEFRFNCYYNSISIYLVAIGTINIGGHEASVSLLFMASGTVGEYIEYELCIYANGNNDLWYSNYLIYENIQISLICEHWGIL